MKPASNTLTLTLAAMIVLFGAASWGFMKYQRVHVLKRLEDPSHHITRIIQTGPQKQALKTPYLAELLELSSDRPRPLELFSIKEGVKKLLASRVIKEARIEQRPPNALYIDYTVREPLCLLLDFENTALDDEGELFPLSPYFSPKNLPELYLNLDVPHIPQDRLEQAYDLLRLFAGLKDPPFRLKRIDLSLADEASLGRRELVIQLQLPLGGIHTLRLNPKTVHQQIANYIGLLPTLDCKDLIVDLRLEEQAYLLEHKSM